MASAAIAAELLQELKVLQTAFQAQNAEVVAIRADLRTAEREHNEADFDTIGLKQQVCFEKLAKLNAVLDEMYKIKERLKELAEKIKAEVELKTLHERLRDTLLI